MAAAAGPVNWLALKCRISALFKAVAGGGSGDGRRGKANVYPALRPSPGVPPPPLPPPKPLSTPPPTQQVVFIAYKPMFYRL